MAWKPEVQTDNTGAWYGNALRFETKQEALHNVQDLAWRWLVVRDYRVVECDDVPNYRWDDVAGLVPLETVEHVT